MSSGGGAVVSVIRGVLGAIRPSRPLLIVSQHWPSWLVVALAHNIPIAAAAFPRDLHRYFKPKSKLSWQTIDALQSQPIQTGVIGVISGSLPFIRSSLAFLPSVNDCIICVEPTMGFRKATRLERTAGYAEKFFSSNGMLSAQLAHADYGGATSARHVLGFGSNICQTAPTTTPNVRRGLGHFLSVRVEGRFRYHPPPPALLLKDRVGVCYLDSSSGIVRPEGLLPCTKPNAEILCHSVFSKQGFVVRPLTFAEAFRVYSIPTTYDTALLDGVRGRSSDTIPSRRPLPFESSVSPDILTSISHQLWGGRVVGGPEDSGVFSEQTVSDVTDTPRNDAEMNHVKASETKNTLLYEELEHLEEDEERELVEEDKEERELVEEDKDLLLDVDAKEEGQTPNVCQGNLRQQGELQVEGKEKMSPSDARQGELTKQRVDNIGVEAQGLLREVTNQSKAAKADDAAVPEHLWNNVIREGAPPRQDRCSGCVDHAVGVLREWGLKRFWKTLRTDCIARLRKNYGKDWTTLPRVKDG